MENVSDDIDVALLRRHTFRCRPTPHHDSGSSANQLRGDRADRSDLATLVGFLEPLECAAQHEAGRPARLVTGNADDERMPPNTFARYCATIAHGQKSAFLMSAGIVGVACS